MNALLIIDMQDAYFKTPRILAQKAALTSAINRLIQSHERNGDMIINIMTAHHRDASTWTLNMLDDDKGFAFHGDDETKNVAGLQTSSAIPLTKTRDSAFLGTNLHQLLKEHSVEQLTIAGVSAHSCIFFTAADAYARNYPVILPSAAIGDEDPELMRRSLEFLAREYRQTIR